MTPLSILCRLGFHRWSVWTKMHGQDARMLRTAEPTPEDKFDDCQERTCLRCNLEHTRFWYDA